MPDKPQKFFFSLFLLALAACGGPAEPERLPKLREEPADLGTVVDHHMHLRSHAFAEFLAAAMPRLPEAFREEPNPDQPTILADDLIRELDAADIRFGAVFSAAYVYEMPEIQPIVRPDERYEMVRVENDFTAAEVARYPDRLVALCGLNPLMPYASEEATRCKHDLGMVGVKMHFFNSGVDLRNPDHLTRLRELFIDLEDLNMPVAVHLHTRHPAFGGEDVTNFIRDVIAVTPQLDLYLLHMAAWGGPGPDKEGVIDAWTRAVTVGELAARENIYFELSASYSRRDKNELLADMISELGASRVVFGADWDAAIRPVYGAINFYTHVPIDESAALDVLDNVAPLVDKVAIAKPVEPE